MKDMKGKTVLITGSSIGIGRETAYKFAGEGSSIVITYYRDKKEAEATAGRCRELGSPEVLVLHLDVMDSGSIRDAVSRTVKKFGSISVLINNAGVIAWENLDQQDFGKVENQVRTNLEGLIKMTMESLPHVTDTIINIASGAGKQGFSGLAPYCATKFGVRGFTQALAQELSGIRAVTVNPGMTATRMSNYRGDPPEKVADVILRTAKGELGSRSGDDVDVWEHI
jgi:NAD(P)-dependent dehydrogenase (short-subunit alcohol dehydrogenase family)